jgi:DNA-nicking Smr family endonuclease
VPDDAETASFTCAHHASGIVEGWAPGFERWRLRSLRNGEIEPEDEVDLHGLHREEARRKLGAAIAAAIRQGLRCVRVVHGRGTRSEGGEAVLRSALPGWLAEPPHGRAVLAFAADEASRGGATCVLLRRRRG